MPEIGEKVKTSQGLGYVVQKNLFEEAIKVRLILEPAKGDKPEKLSDDIMILKKNEVTRIERRKDDIEDIEDELPEEIVELIKD